MARLLSMTAIVLLLLASNGPPAECRQLRLAGELRKTLTLRRLLVGAPQHRNRVSVTRPLHGWGPQHTRAPSLRLL
jgi:hypothetical protein